MIPLVATWASSLIASWFGGLWSARNRGDYYEARLKAARRAYGFLEQEKDRWKSEARYYCDERNALLSLKERLERQLVEIAKDNARLIAEGSKNRSGAKRASSSSR